MRSHAPILILFTFSVQGILLADGMPIENGRFSGGPTTVLSLTPEQAAALEETRTLVLTEDQRDRLQSAAGAAPAALLIYNTMKGENDCGCFGFENRALWFAPAKIEVPHEYVAGKAEFPSARGPSLIILLGVILLAATAFALTFAVLKVRRGG